MGKEFPHTDLLYDDMKNGGREHSPFLFLLLKESLSNEDEYRTFTENGDIFEVCHAKKEI